MIVFNDDNSEVKFRKDLNSILPKGLEGKDYLNDVLKPAIAVGDWDVLNKMPIYKDEDNVIYFSDKSWNFKDTYIGVKSTANIYFHINEDLPDNAIRINNDECELINQIKCLVLIRIYYTRHFVTLSTTYNVVRPLRIIARKMIDIGIHSFSSITDEQLFELKVAGFDFTPKDVFTGLNNMKQYSDLLPFDIQYSQLNHKSLNVQAAIAEEHTVIPLRIYSSLVNKLQVDISEFYGKRCDLEEGVEKLLRCYESAIEDKIRKIRCGESTPSKRDLEYKSVSDFMDKLSLEGVDLVDYCKDNRWMKLFDEIKPIFHITEIENKKISVGGKMWTIGTFKRFIFELNLTCAWAIMIFSGMRTDELFSMNPTNGAQTVTLVNNSEKATAIHIFTTRQSKVTPGIQSTDDTFVTNEYGHQAFNIIKAISEPFRSRLPEKDKQKLFINYTKVKHACVVTKKGLSAALINNISNLVPVDLSLTKQDIVLLNQSNPERNFSVGDTYKLTPHQARRSLAYYLIGYELCSFPSLKQQLGHFSMAMTRWYARNAAGYSKFWKEVNDERNDKKAQILIRIFEKMSNGERIAGGKGKSYLNAIDRDRENYFAIGNNKRYLSKSYWEKMLRDGMSHLHAIAPGMYCTNRSCAMRIDIDLSECIDCDYDYIENVVYAESSRMDAMLNLNQLIELNDLSYGSVTKLYMQIKSAEKIMNDLDFDFEPFVFTGDIENMVLKFNEV